MYKLDLRDSFSYLCCPTVGAAEYNKHVKIPIAFVVALESHNKMKGDALERLVPGYDL
ncbi:hypothetical protein SLEP1_g41012 [Rubroshorea leprosula]|uniref:Uncharacterized protein n=1 Tax=Rubroshorea leprosula TaxID=152421 RepID=A0AAV5L5M8_9ROSI|nr:hypothetical protein SLEP1_g41012 [Rubroshorea leprosula]